MSRYEDGQQYQQKGEQRYAPELDVFDLVAFVWTEIRVAIIVALCLFIPLFFLAFHYIKPSYEATSRLMIILDDDLTPGVAGNAQSFTLNAIMESESQILNSDAVRRKTLVDRSGMAPEEQVRLLKNEFSTIRSPNSNILLATFSAADPDTAANTLNAIVDAYLAYRVELLLGEISGPLKIRLDAAENGVQQAQNALRAYLLKHGIADFEAEQNALTEALTGIQAQQYTAQAQAASANAFVEALRARLSRIPQQINLSTQSDLTGQLLALEVERQSLLGRYQADAPPVQSIEREIAVLEAFIQKGGGRGKGDVTVGINPVWQALQEEKLRQESNAESQRRLSQALSSQVAQLRVKLDRFRKLAPEYAQLNRALMSQNLTADSLATAGADAISRRSAPSGVADAVRVVERAMPPSQSKSLLKVAIALILVISASIGVMAAALRGYWRAVRSKSAMRNPTSPVPPARPTRSADTPESSHTQQAPPQSGRRQLPILGQMYEF